VVLGQFVELDADRKGDAVTEGDCLRLRATSAATLAGAVTRPVWQISIKTAQR